MAMIELKRMRPAVGFLALSLGIGVVACSSSSSSGDDNTGTGTQAVGCSTDPRVETMVPNLTRQGDNLKKGMPGLTFVIAKADYIPPATANNTWTLKVLDMSGQPMNDAVLTFPLAGHPSDPWMPDHSHPDTHAMAVNNHDGTYTVSPLYFFMAGVWSTYIQAQVGSTTDTTTFTVCANSQ
jgi:hypothetical protein